MRELVLDDGVRAELRDSGCLKELLKTLRSSNRELLMVGIETVYRAAEDEASRSGKNHIFLSSLSLSLSLSFSLSPSFSSLFAL